MLTSPPSLSGQAPQPTSRATARLCHVSAGYHPFVGGAQTYLQAMSERFAGLGHRVDVLTTDAGEVEAFWHPAKRRATPPHEFVNGVQVRRSPLRHIPFSPWSFYALRRLLVETANWAMVGAPIRRLSRYLPWTPGFERALADTAGPIDITHAVNIAFEWPVIVAWRFARRCGSPFIVTPFVHTGEPGTDSVVRNYTMPHQMAPLRDADAVIVQTEIERDCLAQRGVRPDRLHILGVGIDPAAVTGGDGAAFRSQHRIAFPMVLFMGVLTKDKGAAHVVEAMRVLWDAGVEATLVMVGQPVDEFERYWRRLPARVTQRIVRTGIVSEQAKRDALAAADLFVLPSRVDSFGIVFLEAWANRLPVIGARAGGIPGVVDEGEDGLLAAYGDVQSIAASIKRLLDDAALRLALGANGERKVAQRYTWDWIFQRLNHIYGGLLNARPVSHSRISP